MKKIIAGSLLAVVLGVGIAGTAHAGTPEQNTQAMQQFSATVGVATTTGALIGTGVGFVMGCVVGGIITGPTLIFVPAGCIAGGITGAGLGGVAGTLLVGGPTAIIEGVQMVEVLATPAPAIKTVVTTTPLA